MMQFTAQSVEVSRLRFAKARPQSDGPARRSTDFSFQTYGTAGAARTNSCFPSGPCNG